MHVQFSSDNDIGGMQLLRGSHCWKNKRTLASANPQGIGSGLAQIVHYKSKVQ